MFTPDGRVREDYAEPAEPSPAEAAPSGSAMPPDVAPAPVAESPEAARSAPRLELPGAPAGLGPGFLDLVGVLAEPVAFYLGDAALPDGKTMVNLDMARLHIDLLDVLRQRTAGNLTAEELGVLEDLLYQLRVRYVQKRG